MWEGLGIVGIALTGHLLFGEHLTPTRLIALGAIIAGIVLLERGMAAGSGPDARREPVSAGKAPLAAGGSGA